MTALIDYESFYKVFRDCAHDPFDEPHIVEMPPTVLVIEGSFDQVRLVRALAEVLHAQLVDRIGELQKQVRELKGK